ncbi:hypothetical protein PR003_g34754, partial [Phytophthora rubi]
SVQEAGKLLILQFSSPLGENVLRKTLTEAKKRRVETYMEYDGRLLDIADSLPGGSSLETNSRQAVYAFVEHAHPAYEKDLDRLVRKKISKGIPARAVLDTAVAELVALTKSNGQAELYRSRYAPKRGPPSADVEDQPAKRSKDSDGRAPPQKEKALAVVVDRSAKQHKQHKPGRATAKKPGWKITANTRCYECNGYG